MPLTRAASVFRWCLMLGAVAALVASSCTLDRAGSLVVGGGGAGNTGGTGQGGDVYCTTLEDCPLPETQCEERSCVEGWCGMHDLFPGTECHENGGQVCDGEGHCIKDLGIPCAGPEECLSGHCVEGLCCDTACDGECESCGDDVPFPGTCTPFVAGSACSKGVCDGVGECASGDHVFSVEYGESGVQSAWSIAVGPSDEILVGGYFDGEVNFGGGSWFPSNEDGYVLKLDAAGLPDWDLHLAGSDYERVAGVAVDSLGNMIVCGHFSAALDLGAGEVTTAGSYDIFLIKLDPAGSHVWSHRFGDSQWQTCRGVAVDSEDSVIIAAELYGSTDFGKGILTSVAAGDVVVAKFDDAGLIQWANRYGDAAQQDVWDLAVDPSDRIVVVGDFFGTIDFGGTPLYNPSSRDVFVARFDPDGGHLYSGQFGDPSEDAFGEAVAVDQVHHIVIGGSFTGTINFGEDDHTANGQQADGFVARLDGLGNLQWDRTFGDNAWQGVWALAIDNSNNVIVGGEFYGQIDLGGTPLNASNRDVFVAKYAYDGTHLWSGDYGSNGDQYLESLATNSQRRIIVGGHFDGTIDFGDNPLTSDGDDLYLAILEP